MEDIKKTVLSGWHRNGHKLRTATFRMFVGFAVMRGIAMRLRLRQNG